MRTVGQFGVQSGCVQLSESNEKLRLRTSNALEEHVTQTAVAGELTMDAAETANQTELGGGSLHASQSRQHFLAFPVQDVTQHACGQFRIHRLQGIEVFRQQIQRLAIES